jgi:transcriptional regulator CtsR
MVSLQERDVITARERLLIEVSLRNQEEQGRVLFDLPPYRRDTLRAELLKRILVSLAMS